MVDVRKPATLRGFPVSVADVGDQMHLCHPLLSFEGDPALYLAHRLDWQNNPEALAIADPNEVSALGTLLPPAFAPPIASGEGLVAVGAELVQTAAAAEVELLDSEIAFARVDGSECWIGVATPALYTTLRTRLAEEARAAFDEALEDAAHHESRLSERGNAALLLMRKCGTLRRDDLAIRQLAGAWQNKESDLYRRLLIRFALELDTQEDVLNERVKQHVAVVCHTMIVTDHVLSGSRYGAVERLHGRMYSKTIGGGLISPPSGAALTDWYKNHLDGIVEKTPISDHKARFLDTGKFSKFPIGNVVVFSIHSNSVDCEKIRDLYPDFKKSPMVLKKEVEHHTERLPRMVFELQENQKTNHGSLLKKTSGNLSNPLIPE